MSVMSRLYTEIQIMIEEGYDFKVIADKLEVPESWVAGVHNDMLNNPQDSYDCYDTVNS